jgi:heavy metal sensor kinase
MRSIRLSLVIYLLVLLAVALGAFFSFVYASATDQMQGVQERLRTTLKAKYDLMGERLEQQNKMTAERLREAFDRELSHRVHLLPQETLLYLWSKVTPIMVCGVLGAGSQPSGLATNYTWAIWASEPSEPWLVVPIARGANSFDIRVRDPWHLAQIGRDEPQVEGFFQVSSETGTPLQSSRALRKEHLRLESEQLKVELLKERFDDIVLASGKHLRMVTLKSPVGLRPFSFVRRPAIKMPEMPVFYWQYCMSTNELDNDLAALQKRLEDTRGAMESELYHAYYEQGKQSEVALASLRTWLFLTILVTFLGIIGGGVWLVRRGLKPIERISLAVSKVSEKDFELHLAPERTPRELASIVDKLKESLLSLKRAFEREKQAAADISHELRTPIASLMATIQVSLRKQRPPEEYRQTLQSCAEIGQQLGELVERLLALARLDAGTDQIDMQLVDVPELAEQCVQMIKPLAETRGLSLRLDRNGPVTVETDAAKLRDVLINLLHNAMQYNKPRGDVEVRVHTMDGQAALEVRDTGVGIPREALPHLFERFYRVDPSRQSDTIHAGLGLSIVKGYLDLMGGRIDVESQVGQGTTFRVRLPLAKEIFDSSHAIKVGVPLP